MRIIWGGGSFASVGKSISQLVYPKAFSNNNTVDKYYIKRMASPISITTLLKINIQQVSSWGFQFSIVHAVKSLNYIRLQAFALLSTIILMANWYNGYIVAPQRKRFVRARTFVGMILDSGIVFSVASLMMTC